MLLCFKADNFIFRFLSVTSLIRTTSVASFSIMEKWSKSLKCWSAYSLTGTGGISYNLFNSFLSSLLSPVYQVGIYFNSGYFQVLIKGNKIFNSDFVVFTQLSKKTLIFFTYFIVICNAVDRFLSKPILLEAVSYCFCRYISPSNL